MGKNILLLISGAIIIYLLKNKQTVSKQIVLESNANLLQSESGVTKPLAEYKYKNCIYSDNAIKANLIEKKDRISKITLPGIIATDAIKISGIPLVY
jgi:hypothetical protein